MVWWMTRLLLVMGCLCGAGMAWARGPWRADPDNTSGWYLMTPEERVEHQAKIRGFTRFEDCRAYQFTHHRWMEARAAERGLHLPQRGRDFCAPLRARSPAGPPASAP